MEAAEAGIDSGRGAGHGRAHRPRRARWALVLLAAGLGVARAEWGPAEMHRPLTASADSVATPEPPAGGGRTEPAPPGQHEEAPLPRHILKRFDFDERKLGNVEDVPMYWLRRLGSNLPHYNVGRFDMTEGHTAAPSFKLTVTTESVAYTYSRNDIPVEPGARYLVSAWVRTQGLRNSQAAISVAYLTRDMQVLPGSEVFSAPVQDDDDPLADPWRRLEVTTGECPRGARFLQIAVWLTQADFGRERPSRFRPIARHDAYVAAWFDDIEVSHLLPATSLRLRDDMPIIAAGSPVELIGPKANPAHVGLTCHVTVTDDDGRIHLRTQTDPQRVGNMPAEVWTLTDLPAGLYVATLRVLSNERQIMQQRVRFVKLPHLPPAVNKQIGIYLEPSSLVETLTTAACVQGLQAGYVKIPLWTQEVSGEQVGEGDPLVGSLLQLLLPGGVEPVGMLVEPPTSLAELFPYRQRHLVDVLSGDPQLWRPYLAMSLTHYADVVRHWQVGADDDVTAALDARYPTAAAQAAEQVTTLIGGAQVALSWPAVLAGPAAPPPVRRLSLMVPEAIVPEQIPAYLAEQAHGQTPLWLYLQPLADGSYTTSTRRADLAQRIVYSLAGGAQAVFVPQPWSMYEAGGRRFAAPSVEYTVVATLARALANRQYGGRFTWMDGTEFHIFTGIRDAVLVAWNNRVAAPDDPAAAITLYLGSEPAAWDLRGRSVPVQGTEEQTLAVWREPVVITGADARLALLRSRFDVQPRLISSGLRSHRHTITLANPYEEPVSGTIRLRGPQGWEILPSRLGFSLPPGGRTSETIEIQVPYNESTGRKIVRAELIVESRRMQQVTIPVVFDLQLPGIDTYAFAESDGQKVIIRHVLTNRTKKELSFVGSALIPLAGRQERLFLHVQPGQTVIKEYIMLRDDLDGQRQVRLSLREVNGSRMLNQVVDVY